MTMARGSTPLPPPGTAQPSASTSPAYRSPLESQRQGNAFQQQMERLSREDGVEEKGKSPTPKSDKAKIADDPEKNRGNGEQDQQEASGNTAASGHAAFRATMVEAPAKANAPMLPSEQMDRIAAAIHELTTSGIETSFQLKLPAGPTMIDSVLLGRDAAGRITIQLIANAQMPSGMIQTLQQGLTQRLREKQLRLGKIGVSQTSEKAISGMARG